MQSFLDTSAILDGALNRTVKPVISPLVLTELEGLKHSTTPEVAYKARKAIKEILEALKSIEIPMIDQKKVDKLIKTYNFLTNINDHRLLCEAELFARNMSEPLEFVTSDIALYLFSLQMPHLTGRYYYDKEQVEMEEYTGWTDYYPDDNQLNLIYSSPQTNVLKCRTNEFAKIYQDGKVADVLFWDGSQYRNLKYKPFTAPTGETISPRNLEQKMYLDLLQNDKIPIKLCVGNFGTGKSMFAETWAIHQVMQGKYDKIVFVKNNLDVKGAGKLGTLPGDEIAKQYPWLRQIEDHMGVQLFEQYLNEGIIEPAHLSTLRGRDLKNCIILVDEAENLLTTNIQLLLGRVAENSQIIFCADIKQCDYKDVTMSGIPKLINSLAGHSLFGMVKLKKSERSLVAACADLLDK